jgi:hypothetical protein
MYPYLDSETLTTMFGAGSTWVSMIMKLSKFRSGNTELKATR